MARNDALLRISKTLLGRRAELRKRIGDDLTEIGVNAPDATGDAADVAFDHAGVELTSHLAEVETKELAQVERALVRIKQGKYGVCDGCGCKIPVARLNALPYSTLCVACQRESEADAGWTPAAATAAGWDKLRDAGDDREITFADLEIDLRK